MLFRSRRAKRRPKRRSERGSERSGGRKGGREARQAGEKEGEKEGRKGGRKGGGDDRRGRKREERAGKERAEVISRQTHTQAGHLKADSIENLKSAQAKCFIKLRWDK